MPHLGAFVPSNYFAFNLFAITYDLAYSTDAGALPTGILCGSWNCPHIARSFQATGVVIGLRNCKTASRRSRSSSSKRNHIDKGSVCSHTGGMYRARAAFQTELSK